jgi:uncharacterized protein YciI
MPQFLYLIRPKNDWTNGEMTEDENRLMGEHFMYLKKNLEEGKLMMAGPCIDKSLGVGVIEADTKEEVEEIGKNDPAVKAGIVTLELKEMRVSLWRK